MVGRMSPLEPLAPDQRAVVALVLQQGRSYDEIAALLGIPVDAVRARAQAGLAALAPADGLPGQVTGPLADYLLGQQPPRDAEATRGLLAESAPARDWAAGVADRLAGVAPGPLPEIPAPAAEPAVPSTRADAVEPEADPDAPAGAAEPDALAVAEAAAGVAAPRPRPVREPPPAAAAEHAPPPASRLGGIFLIVAVLAVVAAVAYFVIGTGDDEEPATAGTATATATPAPTATAAPAQVADEIALRAPAGGDAQGTMTVYLQSGQLLFALEAQGVPANTASTSYAVWLTGPGGKARRLGFTEPVAEDGQLGIQGPSEKDLAAFPKLYATYANVVVSEESSESGKRPRKIVLAGKLPQGR
jgi:hypothetical protein